MTKILSLTAMIALCFSATWAQQPGKVILNCMGGIQSANGLQLKFSVGDPTASAFVKNNGALYQGFLSGNQSVVLNTSIDDLVEDNAQVYPNPVSHLLHLKSSEALIQQVEVTNCLGQLVHKQTDDQVIHVHQWESGLYFVRITTDNKHTSTIKIIKQ